jgi:hypothetical protein
VCVKDEDKKFRTGQLCKDTWQSVIDQQQGLCNNIESQRTLKIKEINA